MIHESPQGPIYYEVSEPSEAPAVLFTHGITDSRKGGKAMANALAVAGPNSKYQLEGAQPAGFWAGLWHGIIAPITFIVSLFNPGVRIYEVHNNGRWYDFGFVLGVSGSFGGGGSQAT